VRAEYADFIRRVANGELYTGTSGTAMAQWAVGWHGDESKPRDYPRDGGDFGRCMNVYWAAPDELKPMMRTWLQKQGFPADFNHRSFYGPGHRYGWSR
jgi:hypothetical protein